LCGLFNALGLQASSTQAAAQETPGPRVRRVRLRVRPSDTIVAVKRALESAIGTQLPDDQLYFIYEGKRLESNKRLTDHNVKRDATIQVNIKLSGGMDPSRALRNDPMMGYAQLDNDVDMADAHVFANNDPMDIYVEWDVPQQFPVAAEEQQPQPQPPPPVHDHALQRVLDHWGESVCTNRTGMHEASHHERLGCTKSRSATQCRQGTWFGDHCISPFLIQKHHPKVLGKTVTKHLTFGQRLVS
jgi:hypothetical protein